MKKCKNVRHLLFFKKPPNIVCSICCSPEPWYIQVKTYNTFHSGSCESNVFGILNHVRFTSTSNFGIALVGTHIEFPYLSLHWKDYTSVCVCGTLKRDNGFCALNFIITKPFSFIIKTKNTKSTIQTIWNKKENHQ